MSIFNLFNRKIETPLPDGNTRQTGANVEPLMPETDKLSRLDPEINAAKAPDIPESVFVEYEKPKNNTNMENGSNGEIYDLHTLYRFLEQNLEKKGYEDALVNPDTSYMDEHIKFIQTELSLVISRVKTYYNSYLRTIEFHIETRKRNGMVETVDELLAHKENTLGDIKNVLDIEQDSKQGTGLSQNLVLGYRRGFKNGFAAITYGTVLNKKG